VKGAIFFCFRLQEIFWGVTSSGDYKQLLKSSESGVVKGQLGNPTEQLVTITSKHFQCL